MRIAGGLLLLAAGTAEAMTLSTGVLESWLRGRNTHGLKELVDERVEQLSFEEALSKLPRDDEHVSFVSTQLQTERKSAPKKHARRSHRKGGLRAKVLSALRHRAPGSDEEDADQADAMANEGAVSSDALSGENADSEAGMESEVSASNLTEVEIEKARGILNNMLVTSQKKLDLILVDCSGRHNDNQVATEQVNSDVAFLSDESIKAKDMDQSANDRMTQELAEMQSLKEESAQFNQTFVDWKASADVQLAAVKSDYAVAKFILKITGEMVSANPAGDSLLQHGQNAQGRYVYRFDDPRLQNLIARFQKKESRMLAMAAIGASVRGEAFQPGSEFPDGVGSDQDVADPIGAMGGSDSMGSAVMGSEAMAVVANATVTGEASVTGPSEPVATTASPEDFCVKCVPGRTKYGLLHDNMSRMLGKFSDDAIIMQREYTAEYNRHTSLMSKNQDLRSVSNMMYEDAKSDEAAALAKQKGISEEMNDRESTKTELDETLQALLKECKEKVETIMFEEFCGAKKVRNEIQHKAHEQYGQVTPYEIRDCEMETDWTEGECSIPCDDAVPAVGGTRTLTRGVALKPSKEGMACPSKEFVQRCGRFPCPVDCIQSPFSGWSTCSAICDTGEETRTRSIEEASKYGGERCGPVEEVKKCALTTCFADCELEPWMSWSPCTQSCAAPMADGSFMAGVKERRRPELEPARGGGTCPARDAVERFETNECNTNACVGDEVCIAHMDLIIAIDSSGSMGKAHFEKVLALVSGMLDRLKPKAFGKEGVRVGLMQFGNGMIAADGSISEPETISELTPNVHELQAKLKKQKWSRGFTNLAQAFSLARTMFSHDTARADAASVFLAITDAMPSFSVMTESAAKLLDKEGARIFIAGIKDTYDADMEALERYVSLPPVNHVIHIPGFTAMGSTEERMANTVTQLISRTCPQSESPSQEVKVDNVRHFKREHLDKDCPCWHSMLSDECPYDANKFAHRCATPEDCFEVAQKYNITSFTFAKPVNQWGKPNWSAGLCWSGQNEKYQGPDAWGGGDHVGDETGCNCVDHWTGETIEDAWYPDDFDHYIAIDGMESAVDYEGTEYSGEEAENASMFPSDTPSSTFAPPGSV